MNVWRLIAKDVVAEGRFLPILFLMGLASGFALYAQMDHAPASVYPAVIHLLSLVGGFIICFRTVVAEEKNKAFLFLKTLPLRSWEIVVAKFVTNWLLVAANFAVLAAFYAIARATGWRGSAPPLTVSGLWAGLMIQWLSNAVFLCTALMFDSEKAIWAPFPLIWVAITVMANFERIVGVLHLEPLVRLLFDHTFVLGFACFWTLAVLASAATAVFERKRSFG